MMVLRLSEMLVQPALFLEDSTTLFAVVVLGIVMIFKLALTFKMFIAILAVEVSRALHIMFF
jgi:hypothetical protein